MIHKAKIPLLFLMILFTYAQSFSQKKLEYSEIFENIKKGDNDKSYTLLLDYQKSNPDFANTYFQLGLISYQWAFEFNPFTDFSFIKLFIYNTKLYFNLAKLKLNEEKKKNLEFYMNQNIVPIGEKIQTEQISSFIDKKIQEISEYEEHIQDIIKYFNKSSDKYNECVKNFMTINAEYSKIKNLYLSDNEENNKIINRLETDFDSVLVYFNLYKQALAQYPLKGYNQSYVLKDIITFRLDGLTASNFLDNEIILWHYKKWLNEVKEIKSKIISSNKDEITIKNEEIVKMIDYLSGSFFSDTIKNFKIDEKFIYKIEKYDNNSFLIQLFKLNESIINYLITSNKLINNPDRFNDYSLTQKASYSLAFYNQFNQVERDIIDFEKNIVPEQIKKYPSFYMSAYNGIQGLKDYAFRQKLLLKEKKDIVIDNLNKKFYRTAVSPSFDSLYFKGKKVEIYKSNPILEVGNGNYVITDFRFDKNNKYIFSGIYKNAKNKLSSFNGIKETSTNKLIFNQSIETDTCDILNLVVETNNGTYFTVQTNVGSVIENYLIQYSDMGKKLLNRKLPQHRLPGFMYFDEINNAIVIIFNGTKLNTSEETDDEQIIYIINPNDELLSFESKFNAQAKVFDIVKINNKYLLFSNYSYYLSDGNKKYPVNNNQEKYHDILVSVISLQGETEKQIPIEIGSSVIGFKAVKINSDAINILGYKTTKPDYNLSNINNEELFWMIINSNVEKVYNGWHD